MSAPIEHLLGIMRSLRDKDTGCPWDLEQRRVVSNGGCHGIGQERAARKAPPMPSSAK